MMATPQDIQFFLRQANKNADLSDWEIDFIESVQAQFEERGTLSPKQQENLKRIAMKD